MENENLQEQPVVQAPPINSPASQTLLSILEVFVIIFCFIIGFVQIIFPLILGIFVVPQLIKMELGLGDKVFNEYLIYFVLVMALIIGSLEITFGLKMLKVKKIKNLILFLVFSFVIYAGFLAFVINSIISPIYKLFSDYQNSSTPINQVPNTTPDETANWKTYTDPKGKFSVKYPPDWKGEIEIMPIAIKHDYDDFSAKSPDYQLSSSIGPSVQEKGAEFFVRVENTNEKSIDDLFNNDPLAPQIAINKTKTTVNNIEAIQYDYAYEGNIATVTELITNNKSYFIKYRYVDNVNKSSHWNIYLNFLETFKFTDSTIAAAPTSVPAKTKITVSGKVYSDNNCNMIKDAGEQGLANVQVGIFKVSDYTSLANLLTDVNGIYSYSADINSKESVTLRPIATAFQGYQDNPKFRPDYGVTTLSMTNPSATVDLYLLPTSGIKNCR